ncbi:MAG: M15 family metallopeptidase, partial [Nanoarchaeota archaeon]
KIPLKLNSSLRTYDEQLNLRKQNVKDKTKVNDLAYLKTALSSNFNPQTGAPGFSNHQNGRAIDVNTGVPAVYKWMVTNGLKYGFVRTVASERWHWEYLPGILQFAYVPKDHPTWDKLA